MMNSRNESLWDGWHRNFLVTVANHDCEEIISANYRRPNRISDPEGHALFIKKNQFMYGVFQKKLKTDYGKSLVRTYHSTMDARKVYFDLLTHMRNSSAACIASQKLLTFTTGYRIR